MSLNFMIETKKNEKYERKFLKSDIKILINKSFIIVFICYQNHGTLRLSLLQLVA